MTPKQTLVRWWKKLNVDGRFRRRFLPYRESWLRTTFWVSERVDNLSEEFAVNVFGDLIDRQLLCRTEMDERIGLGCGQLLKGNLDQEFDYVRRALARGSRKDGFVSDHLRDVSNFTLQFHIKALTAIAVITALIALYISHSNTVESDFRLETPHESNDQSAHNFHFIF